MLENFGEMLQNLQKYSIFSKKSTIFHQNIAKFAGKVGLFRRNMSFFGEKAAKCGKIGRI